MQHHFTNHSSKNAVLEKLKNQLEEKLEILPKDVLNSNEFKLEEFGTRYRGGHSSSLNCTTPRIETPLLLIPNFKDWRTFILTLSKQNKIESTPVPESVTSSENH